MQRYTTKHFWRMKESEDGEFVRHEDAKLLLEDYKAQERFLYNMYKEELLKKWEEHKKVRHLQRRVNAMFYIIMVMMGLAVGKLIGWSFGL